MDLALEVMGALRRSVMSWKGGRIIAKYKEKNTLVKLLSGKHYSLFRHTLVVTKAFISFKYVLLLDCTVFNESDDFEGSTFYLLNEGDCELLDR